MDLGPQIIRVSGGLNIVARQLGVAKGTWLNREGLPKRGVLIAVDVCVRS